MDTENNTVNSTAESTSAPGTAQKFCKHCGGKIASAAVICPLCGCQVEEVGGQKDAQPQIVINNTNANSNVNNINAAMFKKPKNKWVSLLLCLFLGYFGAHKFYEGKAGMGILYLLTGGLFLIGVTIDFIILLFKPNPYYV